MFRSYVLLLIVLGLGLLVSCKQPAAQRQQVATVKHTVAVPGLMQPFRYHKLIESSPGKYFDVFSWGRGKDTTGAYMILRSDSTGKQYSATNGDLEGGILDVFNTDMNMDGYPEILIEAKAKDTTNHINIYAYEFRGLKPTKLDFPKLSTKTKLLYHGNDNFYIKEGNLIREFPVYEGTGDYAKPTGQKKVLQYGIRDNEFTVKDITPVDSTAITKPAAKDSAKTTAAKADKPKPTEKSHKKEKRRHVVERHTKRRRHHRRD